MSSLFKTDNDGDASKSPGSAKFSVDGAEELLGICEGLTAETSDYDARAGAELIVEYAKKHKRILYSVISKYIFNLSVEKRGVFITNLDALWEYIGQERLPLDEESKISILKFWDHVHLAVDQCENLRQEDDEFVTKFKENAYLIKGDMEKELQDFKSSMIVQLISLVGIFTAMAFLVFGGINALDNIFNGAKDFPILKICMISSVWGFAIVNLVFMFMVFVSKLTGKPLTYTAEDPFNVKLLVRMTNLALLFFIALFGWAYLLGYLDMEGAIKSLSEAFPKRFFYMGTGGLVVFFGILGAIIYRKSVHYDSDEAEG